MFRGDVPKTRKHEHMLMKEPQWNTSTCVPTICMCMVCFVSLCSSAYLDILQPFVALYSFAISTRFSVVLCFFPLSVRQCDSLHLPSAQLIMTQILLLCATTLYRCCSCSSKSFLPPINLFLSLLSLRPCFVYTLLQMKVRERNVRVMKLLHWC